MHLRAEFQGHNEGRVEHLRQPPASIEAEQAVLGGLMLPASPEVQSRVWAEVADILTEESFYRRDHQLIFRALKHLESKRQPFDCVTVGEFLVKHGHGEAIAGGGYLVELASSTPSAANIRAYAMIVADKAKLRRLIEIGTELVNDGFQPDGRDAVEIIGKAQTRVSHLLDSEPCDLEPMMPVLGRVFDALQQRYERGADGGITGMSIGYDDLDRELNGVKGGQLIILAARPKQGKTTLAQNISEYVALVGKKAVAVFSFEMKPEELGDRMLSSIGDIDGDRIRRGDLDDVDWSRVTEAVRKLRGADIRISRPKAARVEHVCAQIRREKARNPNLALVVIDYLQLMQTSGDNRAQGYGDITRALKLLAGELDITILLLSQLNRELEKRPDKRPIPSDLRDSGSIEQDADVVLFIYRDEVYNRNSRDKGTAEIIIALQRNGPSGMVRLKYRPERFRFENLPDDWEPEPAPEGEKRQQRGFRKVKSVPVERKDVDG